MSAASSDHTNDGQEGVLELSMRKVSRRGERGTCPTCAYSNHAHFLQIWRRPLKELVIQQFEKYIEEKQEISGRRFKMCQFLNFINSLILIVRVMLRKTHKKAPEAIEKRGVVNPFAGVVQSPLASFDQSPLPHILSFLSRRGDPTLHAKIASFPCDLALLLEKIYLLYFLKFALLF